MPLSEMAQVEIVDAMRRQVADELTGSVWIAGDNAAEIKAALADFAEAFKFYVYDDGPAERGSLWQKVRAHFSADAEPLMVERYEAVEQAQIERLRRRREMEQDAHRGEVALRLLAAVENQQEAVIRLGSMIIVKFEGTVLVDVLTPDSMTALNACGDVPLKPELAVQILSDQRRRAYKRAVAALEEESGVSRTGTAAPGEPGDK